MARFVYSRRSGAYKIGGLKSTDGIDQISAERFFKGLYVCRCEVPLAHRLLILLLQIAHCRAHLKRLMPGLRRARCF